MGGGIEDFGPGGRMDRGEISFTAERPMIVPYCGPRHSGDIGGHPRLPRHSEDDDMAGTGGFPQPLREELQQIYNESDAGYKAKVEALGNTLFARIWEECKRDAALRLREGKYHISFEGSSGENATYKDRVVSFVLCKLKDGGLKASLGKGDGRASGTEHIKVEW